MSAAFLFHSISLADRRTEPVNVSIAAIVATISPLLGVLYSALILAACMYVYIVHRAKNDFKFRRKIAPEDFDTSDEMSNNEETGVNDEETEDEIRARETELELDEQFESIALDEDSAAKTYSETASGETSFTTTSNSSLVGGARSI